MSNKADNGSKPLAAPMVAKIEPEDQRSLNLEDVDMSRACVQGDVLVPKASRAPSSRSSESRRMADAAYIPEAGFFHSLQVSAA
ncbi:hypothetical protein [Rhizobium leguminosarum]|jgi:hypothetical protein|uniref:hypothetical protein n=1 Tax=Rhizobium leguminosarum TaxID=384 RepID=UPI001FDF3866|nr:hypothetical protein [Rhizobium leguminosarum]